MALTSAPACPSCVFGAASSTLLWFSHHDVETITVSVIPYVTVYVNGSRSTNYQSITQTHTDIVGSGPGSNTTKTYSREEDITWTVGDATLTYPNTYVQYLGFEGAAVTSGGGRDCAEESEAAPLYLGPNTDAASFIYALPTNATNAIPLPTALLEYLAELPPVSSEFNGQPLTGCAPLNQASVTALQKRRPAYSPKPFSRIPQTTTFSRIPIEPGKLQARYAAGNSSAVYGSGTGTGNPIPVSQSTFVPSEPTNTHTTAFVIKPITGKPIVTVRTPNLSPQPVQSPAPQEPNTGGVNQHTTPTPATPEQPGAPTSNHNSPDPSPSGGGSSPQTSGGSGPNLSSLLSGLDHEPTHGASPTPPGSGPGTPTSQQSGGSGPNLSHLLSGIDHVPTQGTSPTPPGSGPGTLTPQQSGGSGGGSESNRPPPPNAESDSPGPTAPGSPTQAVITTNGHTFTAVQSGSSLILHDASSTATVPVGSAATFEGQTIKAGPSGGSVAVNGHGTALSTAGVTPGAIITTGGHTFTAVASGNSVIFQDGSSTVAVPDGSQTVFEGQTFSAGPSGSAVVVNGKTIPVSAVVAGTTPEAVITAGGHTFTAIEESGSVVLEDGSSTIAVPAGSIITFEGQTVSVGPSGSAAVVNGKTIPVSAIAAGTTSEAVVTAGGHTFTAIEVSGSVILEDASSTITVKDGSVTTFDGQTVSVGPSGTDVVINGKTIEMTATSTGIGGYISSGLTPSTGAAAHSRLPSILGIVLVGFFSCLAAF